MALRANDATELRDDPAFKLALERGPETGAALCSQPTISRMETHHVNILEMNGESYRLSQSRARKAQAAT
ncbi:MAG: hypothetical protein CVT86_07150 [Alphaproteobacteria bacterium HGW-Alphaproteobacteria-8]|nr:MAG: hypothetical protein CVT86_07150 [Alphaproteobacteria bacterium HGW-Alphaproteobacteria-8]